MSITIEKFTAHPIEHEKKKATQQAFAKDAELDTYLEGLVEWAYGAQDVRQFKFAQSTTEVRVCLQNVIAGKPLPPQAAIVANRLLRKETERLKTVEHLSGVHVGMLLQATFTNAGTSGILLAKVDFSEFLGRDDFRSRHGIDKKHRLLKFCLVEFSQQKTIQLVQVGDTNPTIARFWWDEFLELTEERTNNFNTETAFAIFDKFLARKLKKDYPKDHVELHNEVLKRFKRPQPFKFTEFLDGVFDNYQPHHAGLNTEALKKEALALLDKKKFDANFTIVPEAVSKRFKSTYKLTPQIDVTVDGALDSLSDTISSHALADGTQGVFIKSEFGYKKFPQRSQVQSKDAAASVNGAEFRAAPDGNGMSLPEKE